MVGLNLHSTQSMLSFSPSNTPTKQHSIMLMLTITALLSSRLPSSLAVCRGERCVCLTLYIRPVPFTGFLMRISPIIRCVSGQRRRRRRRRRSLHAFSHTPGRTLKAVHTQPYRFCLEFTSKLPVIKVNHRLNRYCRGMVRDGETANRAKGSHKAHSPSRHANSPAARGERRRSTVSFGTAN